MDYEFSGFLFRTPDDIYWESEDLYIGGVTLTGDDISVFAEAYTSKDFKNYDLRDEDDFLDYVIDTYAWGMDYDVESLSNGHYIILDDQGFIGVYADGKQGWLIHVDIHDRTYYDVYAPLAEFIATSGIVLDE